MTKDRKTVLALLIAALFVVSAIAVIPQLDLQPKVTGPGVTNTNTTNVTQNYFGFSFPYVYQQPNVPTTVGVQGVSGPQVPVSSLGPAGTVGPTGHLGPASVSGPETLASTSSTTSIQVYYGTLSPLSRSFAGGVSVVLQNISFGNRYTATTNSAGFANMTVQEGWYMLTITGSGSYIGFSQEINVNSNPFSLVRYLMPAGNAGPAAINNGPSGSRVSLNFHVYFAGGFNAPQLSVSLYNASGGGSLLASEVTNYYGYANFTAVSNSFQYRYAVTGYSQSATGVFEGGENVSGTVSPPSSGSQSYSISLTGRSYWTAGVSGGSPQQGYVGSIGISGPLTFSGGVVHFSAPFSTAAYPLHFVNTVVYFNSSTYNTWPNMYFDNTTVIMQTPVSPFGVVGSSSLVTGFNYSRVFFSALDPTAGEVSQQMGIWLAGNARNSVFVAPHIQAGQVRSTLTGTFANSEFFDFNMTQSITYNPNPKGVVHIRNDRIVNATLSWNTVYIDSSILQRFSMPNIVTYMSYNNSYVNITMWSWQSTLTFGQTADYRHDFITAVDMGSNVNFGNTFTNFSYSYLNFTPKSASSSTYPSLDLAGKRITFYNDFIIDYPSDAVRWGIIQRETGSYQGFGMTIGPNYLSMNYTQLYGMDAIGFFPPHYFWYNFSHVNFSNSWSDQEWNPFEWFSGVVTPAIPTGTFNNCTFYGMHYNSTIWWRQYNLSTDDPIGFWQDLNVPNPPATLWGRIYINYTTVYNIGVGTTDAYAFGISEGGIYSYLNNNLFLNRADGVITPYGTTRWFNGSYQQYPIGTSVEHAAGNTYMSNNWFLNLNNKTVPIQSIVGSAGQGYNALISMSSGNHFFYYPNQLQSYLPVYTTPPKVPFDNNSKNWYLFPVNANNRATAPTYANYTYEIPIAWHGTLSISPYQDQYIFNSSVVQVNIFGPSSNDLSYAWVIEPDVNTSTGRPVISFQNGLAGGIMPNFTWNGTSYQLAVEPNMTYITAQGTSASKVGLQFQVPVGLASLNVWMYNSTTGRNQLIKSVPESGTPSTVTVTYDPATMPLGAVFFTNTTAKYTIAFHESGLPRGTSWAVTLGGVKSTSSSSTIDFNVQNGTYPYSVSSEPGFNAAPLSGNETVNGGNSTVDIAWNRTGYAVQFNENGLSGENWSVTLGSTTMAGNSSTLTFIEPNGTYSYTVVPPSNYTTNESSGNLTVDGSGVNLAISFDAVNSSQNGTSPPPSPPPPPSGSPPPPTTGTPPPAGSPPGGGTGTTTGGSSPYNQLIIQLVTVGIAPSIVLAGYMGIYMIRGEVPRPKVAKRIVRRFKKIK